MREATGAVRRKIIRRINDVEEKPGSSSDDETTGEIIVALEKLTLPQFVRKK